MGWGRSSGFIECGSDWMIRGLVDWMIWEEEEQESADDIVDDSGQRWVYYSGS